jgi:beta-lactamase family protein
MRARQPILLIATAAMLTVSVGGYQAKVYGAPTTASQTSHISGDASLAPAMMPPVWSRGARGAALDGLPARITQATNDAAADGATIAVALLDRASNQLLSNGNDQLIAIASVAKLFIADDVLSQGAQRPDGNRQLSSSDRHALDIMLRSSDDDAAEMFWNELGGETIIADVTRRYGLTSTVPPSDGRWWNTTSSASDLVRYYNMLLNGSGGLSRERAEIIVDDLAASTATGVDGYPQRFGIPDGLYAEPVAVKQGWMCCVGSDWMHLSTGVIGYDRRYIMVVESLQPSDDTIARETITQAVKTMFPSGRIGSARSA